MRLFAVTAYMTAYRQIVLFHVLSYSSKLFIFVIIKHRTIAPTINFSNGDGGKIPVISNCKNDGSVDHIVDECVAISKDDWNSFETSWDFKKHPFVVDSCQWLVDRTIHSTLISNHYTAWESECNDRFTQLKTNEEELNRIFIDIYSLQDELTPEVEDKDITVRKADLQRDIVFCFKFYEYFILSKN